VGVVVQLKDAMNTIWNVEEPRQVGPWWHVRTYMISLASILGLGFLLAVSLVVSAGLAALSSWSGSAAAIGEATNFVVSLAILTALFAMLFKWFPDTAVAWRDVLPGAVATPVLLNLGKFAIGWYIGTQALESTYGAVTSIVVLLVWVYSAAQIVLFGAELTHAYAAKGGPAVLLVREARHRRWHLGVPLCVSVSNPSCAAAKSASRTHAAEDRLPEL
jgi:membrane protein